ncbi:AAA family ATPase [Planctomycetota bacterium]
MTGLPVRLAAELEVRPEEQRWLIEELWAERGVGILGGEPKLGKSWIALDAAVSVASGTPCLRRFRVPHPGPVLLYAAEDALHIVRERLDAITRAAGVALEGLPLHVITAASVRLDLPRDRERLQKTVARLSPRLLVLDPFVRLHRVDENVASEVAPLLAFLRHLERELAVAILLVHHARKSGGARAGQALRGSSELHAWGDSNLYLRRRSDATSLTIEHRAAPSPPPLLVALREVHGGLSMAMAERSPPPTETHAPTPLDRVFEVLDPAPLTVRELRRRCRMNTAALCEALSDLVTSGRACKTATGYHRVA